MNVATVDSLSNELIRDMNWRIREISDLKQAIRTIPPALRASSMRASIPIFYAHWEGHVRVCATGYVLHISMRRLEYKELTRGYMLATLRSEFNRLSGKSLSKLEQMKFIETVFNTEAQRFGSKSEYLVDTKSNLSFATLCEILNVIGIDGALFEPEESFIDRILLDKRNNIAHGQNIVLTDDELEDISSKTIGLMRTFRNLVENAALAQAYKKTPLVTALPAIAP